jgi:hypothetical protein
MEQSPVSAPESFPIDKIRVPEKKRSALNPEMVDEIAQSILESGLRDAILVRREKDHFVLVEGLHRLEACKALGEPAILGRLVSAEQARERTQPQAFDAERDKMERLRKLRLEKEAAEKLANASGPSSGADTAARQRTQPANAIPSNRTATSKPSPSGRGSTPRTLSDWIKQQERSGGRY